MSVQLKGLDLRKLPPVAWRKMKGREDLVSFDRYILPDLKKVPELIALCWHYEQLENMCTDLGKEISQIDNIVTRRALAATPGEFDLEHIFHRMNRLSSSCVFHSTPETIRKAVDKCREYVFTGHNAIFSAANKFRAMVVYASASAASKPKKSHRDGRDLYETLHEENMLREVTAIKWLCLIEHYVRFDLVDACIHNLKLYAFLAKVIGPSSALQLDPSLKFNGTDSLKTLILRASKRAGADRNEQILLALSGLFKEKMSDENAVVNQVPEPEMKDKTALHVLVHMHPDVREAAVHPSTELPDEHTDPVCVSIRLRTLEQIHAQLTDQKSTERAQCESELAKLEKRFVHLGVDWKSVTKGRLTECVSQLKQIEQTVYRFIRFVGEGVVKGKDEIKTIRNHFEDMVGTLTKPDVSILITGRSGATSSFHTLFGKPLEPFYTRLKAVKADCERKDAEDWTVANGGKGSHYRDAAECGELNVAEDAKLAKWHERAVQEFADLRMTRQALAAPSRYALNGSSDQEKIIQGIERTSRYSRYAKRKADQSSSSADAGAGAGNSQQLNSKKHKPNQEENPGIAVAAAAAAAASAAH
jgi:hypothetical protein